MINMKSLDAIRSSGIFDDSWYREQYSDVHPKVDALEHYLRVGWVTRRKPACDVEIRLPEKGDATSGDVVERATLALLEAVNARRTSGVSPAPRSMDAPSGAGNRGPAVRFRFAEPNWPTAMEMPLVSVIVPVHNALEDVKLCMNSLIENTFSTVELIVINDGSEDDTSNWLVEFARRHDHVKLTRHITAQGYTRAVNAGATQASGEYLIILNSDTILPPCWLERLCAPLLQDPSVCAAGPVSNAATWQSVPDIKAKEGGWAVNDMPLGMDVVAVDRLLQRNALGLKSEPVDLLNGFCYAFRRTTFNELNGLDGQAFPSGYGEETDLFMRLKKMGGKAVIVPNLFVYHAKSKSFGVERRKKLSAHGNEVLYSRYSKESIVDASKSLQKSPLLAVVRDRLRAALQEVPIPYSKPSLKISFLLPVRPGGGGVHSVIQEAEGLSSLGHKTQVIIPEETMEQYRSYYPGQKDAGLFETFKTDADLLSFVEQSDVVVATHFKSVRMLKSVQCQNRDILFMYYVQDYEPWITSPDSSDFVEAYASYGELDNCVLVAKTNWICRMIDRFHGVPVHKIAPSIETSIYNMNGRIEDDRHIRISAMLRPKTPRRGPQATIDVLAGLARRNIPNLSIEVFGCSDGDLEGLDLPRGLIMRNAGVLVREQVASLLKRSDLFIDMSTYQAFGRTAVEAMACGCVAAIPEEGGGTEYSISGTAALPLPTLDTSASADRIVALLESPRQFRQMRDLAVLAATQIIKSKAANSFESVIMRQMM